MPVNWDEVDPSEIPDSLVRRTKGYDAILSESIERRLEIKRLKEERENQPKSDAVKPVPPVAVDSELNKVVIAPEVLEIQAQLKALQDQNKAFQDQLAAEKDNALRSQIVNELKLPQAAAQRIQGSTAEQLREDARKMALDLGISIQENGGSSTNGGSGLTPDQLSLKEFMTDKPSNPFDVNAQRVAGGGTSTVN